MTGVEAVSNGVKAFREPVIPTARRTLTIIIALLAVLLAGIAYLIRAYGIQATDPGLAGYQSVLSMLLVAVAGSGVFYYVSIGSILLVLALSANTAYADGFVRRHYHRVSLETRSATPLELNDLTPPLVILPIQNWSHIAKKALRFALKISPDIRAVHVDCGEGSVAFHQQWSRYVEEPTQQAGVATPQLVVLASRYRLILAPIVEYVLEAERCCPNQQASASFLRWACSCGVGWHRAMWSH
jgi:hypothetical protein